MSLPCQHLCCGVLSRMTGKHLALPEPCTVLCLEPGLWEIRQALPRNRTFKVRMPQVLPPGLPSTAQSGEKGLNAIPRNYIHTRQPREVRSDSHTSWRSYVCWRVRHGDKFRASWPSRHLHVQWSLGHSGHQRLEQTHNSWEIFFKGNAMLT